MARGQRLDSDIRDWIEHEAEFTADSGAAIHRRLSEENLLGDRESPDERTVQGIVKAVRWRDDSGVWSLKNPAFTGRDARKVLRVLRAVIRRTPRRALTNEEARWIVRLTDALRDDDGDEAPLIIYADARRYIRATREGASPAMLENLDRSIALSAGPGIASAIAGHRAMPPQLRPKSYERAKAAGEVLDEDWYRAAKASGRRTITDADTGEVTEEDDE